MGLEQAFTYFLLMLVAQVPLLVTAIVGYIKSRAAIAENTRLTKVGTKEAATSAKVAADTAELAANAATDAKEVAEGINKKLNGGIDDAIEKAVSPLRGKIETIEQYVHGRNHDILNALQTLTNQVNTLVMQDKQKV